jgi:UPF0271 protein
MKLLKAFIDRAPGIWKENSWRAVARGTRPHRNKSCREYIEPCILARTRVLVVATSSAIIRHALLNLRGNEQLTSIDLNADLGEGFGLWRMGDDESMLDLVTSANVACGFHAGDPDIMARCFGLAQRRGVAVGAHVSFPDLAGFGRRRIPYAPVEIERLVAYQIGAAQALAHYAGHRLTYVKCHGALANIAESEPDAALAVARATRAVDSGLTLLAIALSEQVEAAEHIGLTVAIEVFADRAYTDEGRLKARGLPGAVIDNPDWAAARALAMLQEQAIVTESGKRLKTAIDSICVHGDTAHAVEMAQRLRGALERAGYDLVPFAPAEV